MEVLQSVLRACLRELLRRLRGDLKQEELGELIHGGQPLVSKWERGIRGVQFIEVFEVCRARGKRFSEFAEEFECMVEKREAEARRSRIPKSHTGFRGPRRPPNPFA